MIPEIFSGDYFIESRRMRKFSQRRINRNLGWWKIFNKKRYLQYLRLLNVYSKSKDKDFVDWMCYGEIKRECYITASLIKRKYLNTFYITKNEVRKAKLERLNGSD